MPTTEVETPVAPAVYTPTDLKVGELMIHMEASVAHPSLISVIATNLTTKETCNALTSGSESMADMYSYLLVETGG